MQEAIIAILLAIHLLAMNLASAGPMISAWLWPRGEGDLRASAAISRSVLRWSLAALFIGAALGGLLLAAPSAGMWAALRRLTPAEYWFAGGELLFSLACMAAMLAVQRKASRGSALLWCLAVASSTNLLYHFPPLMIVLGELAVDPAWASAGVIDRPALLKLWWRPEVLALWAHFALASVAAAAVFALWPIGAQPPHGDPSDCRNARRLAALALGATLLQVPVGLWVVVASRASVRDAVMGGNLVASASFLAGVLAAVALMHALVHLALGDVRDQMRRRAAWLVIVVAALMTVTLRASRSHGDRALPEHAARKGRTATTSPSPPQRLLQSSWPRP